MICCRGTGRQAYAAMQALMTRLKLTVNATKSSLRRLPEESVDFLGYTIGRCYAPTTGQAYLGTYPSKKAVRRVCAAIRAATQRRWLWRDPQDVVAGLNRAVDAHARERFRRWLRGKHRMPSKGLAGFPDQTLYQHFGLAQLARRTRDLPWAKA